MLCIGIDAEPNIAPPERVLQRIALAQERASIREFAADNPAVSWGRLLFSAKEAVIKASYSLAGKWVDFAEIIITFDPDDGAFVASLLVLGPVVAGRRVTEYAGHWLAEDGLVLTAVTGTT